MNTNEANNISSLFKKPAPLAPSLGLKKPGTPAPDPSTQPGKVYPHMKYSAPPAAKPQESNPKPDSPVKKDFGIIDFSKHDVLHGVSNTSNTRYQLNKQLRGVFNSATERSKIANELGKQISSGGTLTKYGAKKALWGLQKSGKLTGGQVSRTLTHLGM